jgi:hypothetical protein
MGKALTDSASSLRKGSPLAFSSTGQLLDAEEEEEGLNEPIDKHLGTIDNKSLRFESRFKPTTVGRIRTFMLDAIQEVVELFFEHESYDQA